MPDCSIERLAKCRRLQFGRNLIWHAERILGDIEQAQADFSALTRGVCQNRRPESICTTIVGAHGPIDARASSWIIAGGA